MSSFFLTFLAIGIGIGIGLLVVLLILCQNQSHSSMIDPDCLIGKNAIVEVPFDHQHRGKVRVQYRQQALFFTATTTHIGTLVPGDIVFIIEITGAIVTVIPESAFYSSQSPR